MHPNLPQFTILIYTLINKSCYNSYLFMKLAILLIACIALTASQTPPEWPIRFQQDFV